MDLQLSTPALLFPAISLLLLAYTNRFLALASLIRNLASQYLDDPNPALRGQINNLRKRVILIRNMQACGILSFLMCVLAMLLVYNGAQAAAEYAFAGALLLMMLSLFISFREIQISVKALEIELESIEKENPEQGA
jgi:hypothetical protein